MKASQVLRPRIEIFLLATITLSLSVLFTCGGRPHIDAFAQVGGTGIAPGYIQLPSHYFQDHPKVLSVDIRHMNKTDNSTNSFSGTLIGVRLYDNTTQKDVPGVTYLVKLTNVNDETRPIISDPFFTDSGVLNLKIHKNEGSNYTQIQAPADEVLYVYLAGQNGTVPIYSPSINTNGHYHLHVEVRGVESIYALLRPDDMPKIDIFYDEKGVLSSVTVVPEFSAVYPVLAISFVGIIILYRFLRTR